MGSPDLTERLRGILDRASHGTEAHGLRFQLLSFEDGVALVRLHRTEPGHTCSECDVTVPIVLNYLLQDLRGVEGLRDVRLEEMASAEGDRVDVGGGPTSGAPAPSARACSRRRWP